MLPMLISLIPENPKVEVIIFLRCQHFYILGSFKIFPLGGIEIFGKVGRGGKMRELGKLHFKDLHFLQKYRMVHALNCIFEI